MLVFRNNNLILRHVCSVLVDVVYCVRVLLSFEIGV